MGKQWKQCQTLFLGGSKITADGDCSNEIKRCLSLEGKLWPTYIVYSKAEITLLTKVRLVKAMVFPVVMYACERWTVKKAEHRKIDAFELWCWEYSLRVPWTAKRYIQSIPNEINPEYSLEGLMAETPILWPPDVKNWLIWKDPDAGKDCRWEGKKTTEYETVGWHHQLDGHEFE